MKLLNLAGFAAFLFVVSQTVFAHPMSDFECRAFATDALTVATLRDQGVEKDVIIQAFMEYLKELPDASYIKDQKDATMVGKMIEEAYHSPQHPFNFSEQEYAKCVQAVKDHEV